ncbi:MAG: hypothetical protein LBT60_02700, partial [Oscillospiraceae bacterium]|nr:hypothetical protein [Oscillospiraceae bacterium]
MLRNFAIKWKLLLPIGAVISAVFVLIAILTVNSFTASLAEAAEENGTSIALHAASEIDQQLSVGIDMTTAAAHAL